MCISYNGLEICEVCDSKFGRSAEGEATYPHVVQVRKHQSEAESSARRHHVTNSILLNLSAISLFLSSINFPKFSIFHRSLLFGIR